MYKEKYLKYKNKFLNLRKQIEEFNIINEEAPINKNKYIALQKQLGGATVCTIEELMTKDLKDCKNQTMVIGSCGDPGFNTIEGTSDVSSEIKDQLITIFNLIASKEPSVKYLDIILGSSTKNNSAFKDLSDSIQLCITPAEFDSYDTILKKIKDEKNINGKTYYMNTYFPLNYKDSNSKEILDLLIKINTSIKVRITNRMCGTCHRSLYYLVKNNIEYLVEPEQGFELDPTKPTFDTPEIKKCFKDVIYMKSKDKLFVIDNINETKIEVWPAYKSPK